MFSIQLSNTNRVSGSDPLRNSSAHVIDPFEPEFLHDAVGLSRSVASSTIDEIDLVTIKCGQIVTESGVVEI